MRKRWVARGSLEEGSVHKDGEEEEQEVNSCWASVFPSGPPI